MRRHQRQSDMSSRVTTVTVAICTWNRAALLDRTLSAMSLLRVPTDITWELLVVNNNCTDDTDDVLQRYAKRLPLRRLFEPKPGLSHARNCALTAAHSDLLLWTDDDVLVDPEWLSEYVIAADAAPQASFFGGTIDPWFEAEPPAWIVSHLEMLQGPYAVRQLGATTRPLRNHEYPFGANMAIRTLVATQYFFNPALGREKDKLASGEDLDLFDRLRQQQLDGMWVGSARVRHFIPVSRLNMHYLRAWFYEGARSNLRLDGQDDNWRWFANVPLFALKALWLARLKRAITWSRKSDRWAHAFRDIPYYKGFIAEARRMRRATGTSS